MKRLWGKLNRNNRLINDVAVELRGEIDADGFFDDLIGSTVEALREICDVMDIENPIWLETNTEEFQRRHKTAFFADNYMDTPEFDCLEIEVIEGR